MLHLFYVFFKTSLWKHRKNTKKGATQIHQVQNCPLGVPKFPPVEEKKRVKKRQETAFTESKDAAVPVWAAEIGRMVLDSCE